MTIGRNIQKGSSLTIRETTFLTMSAAGKDYRQISESMNVSYQQVANTHYRAFKRLGVHTLPAAVAKAIAIGAIQNPHEVKH